MLKKGCSSINKHGRPPGITAMLRKVSPTKNVRRDYDVAKILAESGCNPFAILAQIAMTSKSERNKIEACATLSKYIAPQLKQIDHKVDTGLPFLINISMSDSDKDREGIKMIDNTKLIENK